MLKTKFWNQAVQSLPKGVRSRYRADFEQAERMELALDSLIEAWSRLRRSFNGPALKPRGHY